MRGKPRRSVGMVAVALLLAGNLAPARSEAAEIRAVSGLTPPQLAMGAAIDIVCPKLLAAGFVTQSSAAGDLTRRCREMRQTANDILSSGPTVFSLGMTADQFADALGRLSPDEAASQGSGSVETGANQFRAIAGRLSALRGGVRAASLAGLRLDFDRSTTALNNGPALDAGEAGTDGTGSGRLGAFLSTSGAFGDKDTTAREAGFDFRTISLVGGVDFRFTKDFVAGMALSYSNSAADFLAGLGDTDTNSAGLILYGTYYIGAFYLDLYGDFTWHRYDTARRISYAGTLGAPVDRTARGDTDGQQYSVSVGAGYDWRLGGFTLTPFARTDFVSLHIDGFAESGADGLDLKFRSQTVHSFRSVLGGQVAYAFSVPWGVLQPQLRADWRHEFLNNERTIQAQYRHDPFNIGFSVPTNRPDRDFWTLAAGVSSVFKGGVTAFINYEALLGLRDVTQHTFTGGVRLEF